MSILLESLSTLVRLTRAGGRHSTSLWGDREQDSEQEQAVADDLIFHGHPDNNSPWAVFCYTCREVRPLASHLISLQTAVLAELLAPPVNL